MRRRRSRDQWRAWLVEHESSGMSVAADRKALREVFAALLCIGAGNA